MSTNMTPIWYQIDTKKAQKKRLSALLLVAKRST